MRISLTLMLLALYCSFAQAQTPIAFGQSYELTSETLGEQRTLNVLLPTEYADSTAKSYPVVYLLDGATDEDFFHAAGLLRYLDDHEMMPPAILVGIANVDRKRDFTYPSSDPRDQENFPTTGGSAKFIVFLHDELPAFVDTTFRTTDHKTLVGQSLGGLLATEILLQHPGHFNDYVIVSPSLWWDKEWLCRSMDSLVAELDVVPERLFVSVGEEYPVMVRGSRRLARLMTGKTAVTYKPLPDEDHNTILHEALYRAFDGWYNPVPPRRYHYANARDGLRMRGGPSLDSAVVGKLAYGQSLGIIAQSDTEVEIDGLRGKWTHINSDVGRGWVFDAYLSPVPVFDRMETIQDYAERNLDLTDEMFYSQTGSETSAYYMEIQVDAQGNKLTNYQFHEAGATELKLSNLTGSQASVVATNWMLSKGYSTKVIKDKLRTVTDDLWIHNVLKPEPDGKYLTIFYSLHGQELTIARPSDGPNK